MPTPLVDRLRAWDDTALAVLLRRRPDLAVPPPADVTVLAARAAVRASVHRACDDLDTVALAVLETLVVAGADHDPVRRAELDRLLGPDAPAGAVTAALDTLTGLALVWADEGDGLALVPAARDVVPRHPGGLGRASSGPAGSSALPELLAGVDADERRVLDALAAGPPLGRSRVDAGGPVDRLLRKGLLLRVDADTVELPRQAGLALRGDRPMGDLRLTPPALDTRDRGATAVDRTAGGAALELLRRADVLLAFWGATPPPVLRSGGLGVRDLRRAAREIGSDEATTALLVEILAAADLVGPSDGATPEWLPTTQSDAWGAGGPELRWAVLARAWLELPRLPGLVGGKDDAGRPVNALSDGVRRPLAPRDRRRVLDGLAVLPPGTAPASTGGLAEALAWRAPRRGGRLRDETVSWTLTEATVVGVVALDALSDPGRALLAEPDRVVAALRATLPDPVDHVLLQADLTAIAPGPLEAGLARELDLVADVESAGSATVYRFTDASVRRALDAGRSASDLHHLFATRSATPVPQGLTYLVDDVARRHGRLRGGAAAAFLRSDDEVLLSEVLAHPDSIALELRRIAPTVLVSPLPLAELMAALRASGFSPAAEDPAGAVLDLAARGRRAPARGRAGRAPGTPQPDGDQLARLVDRMRKGDALAAMRNGADAYAGGVALDVLRSAATDGRAVWIGFVDAKGTQSERVIEPVSVGGGIVAGRDRADGAIHQVPLHRITSIALVAGD